jgi:hypothetical protein
VQSKSRTERHQYGDIADHEKFVRIDVSHLRWINLVGTGTTSNLGGLAPRDQDSVRAALDNLARNRRYLSLQQMRKFRHCKTVHPGSRISHIVSSNP